LDLFKRLRSLPGGLEALCDHRLSVVHPIYLEEASKNFQIIRTEREAQERATIDVPEVGAKLNLLTLSLAKEKYSAAIFEDFQPTNEEVLTQCLRTEDRLKTRCAGLLEFGVSSKGYSHHSFSAPTTILCLTILLIILVLFVSHWYIGVEDRYISGL
jgi:hypothetical protein